MCGRYASFRESQDLADAFDVVEMTEAARTVMASWNVAPTDGVRIVVDRANSVDGSPQPTPERQMHLARWGLVPSWAKDLRAGARMINARSESLADKPAFKSAMVSRRCLVLADGYYEWQRIAVDGQPAGKIPYYIHPSDGSAVAFAGLYSWWRDRSRSEDDPARWVLSAAIITAAARDGLEVIHDREPSMLRPDLVQAWLDPQVVDRSDIEAILAQPAPALSWHQVGPAVGNVRNNDAGLIAPV